MTTEESRARSPRSIEDQARDLVSVLLPVPAHLTQHGMESYVENAMARVERLASELDLIALEARRAGQRPEHTEESILKATTRLEAAERLRLLAASDTTTEAQIVRAARPGRLRRRWAVVLTTFASAMLSVHGSAGPWSPWLIASAAALLVTSAGLTLKSGE